MYCTVFHRYERSWLSIDAFCAFIVPPCDVCRLAFFCWSAAREPASSTSQLGWASSTLRTVDTSHGIGPKMSARIGGCQREVSAGREHS